jgi:hypothetical protein
MQAHTPATKLDAVPLPKLDTIHVQIAAPDTVRMSGTVALLDPGPVLGGFIRSLHQAALDDSLQELRVDIRGLRFVNSSTIRLFVDWTTWLKDLAPDKRYLLRFVTTDTLTWQRTCFSALRVIASDVLAVDNG